MGSLVYFDVAAPRGEVARLLNAIGQLGFVVSTRVAYPCGPAALCCCHMPCCVLASQHQLGTHLFAGCLQASGQPIFNHRCACHTCTPCVQDKRITMADWTGGNCSDIKALCPFGQIPVLFLDDSRCLAQSAAIGEDATDLHADHG